MSDIIRTLNRGGTEQEQRQIQRALARLTRSVRQESIVSAPSFSPPGRPVFPAGVVPVILLNPPIISRGRVF